jgi:hypothetical protein
VEFISQFFGTIPDAGRALWDLIEGFYGIAIIVASVLIAVALGLGAIKLRDGHGWLSAALGMMAGFVAFWWAFGIIPSAFIYFADGSRDLLEGTMFPGALPMMDNAYQVFRDSIVVGLTVLAVVAFSLAAAAIQRRYPRTLAEGEEKAPASGGYR